MNDEDREWLIKQLNTYNFYDGVMAIKELIDNTGYGSVIIWDEGLGRAKIVTGGWSFNEEVMALAYDSFWHIRWWQSSWRGGLYLYGDWDKRVTIV